MTDWQKPQIEGDSPEAVAFALMLVIARIEGKMPFEAGTTDREWVLQTYGQCLEATSKRSAGQEILEKIAQSDVPDNMLALLTALKAATGQAVK